MIPQNVKNLMQKLVDNNFQAYIIGGAVRDYILGQTPEDWDIFTDATGVLTEEQQIFFSKYKML